MILASCENEDISAPNPNLYLGTWQLVGSTVNNENIILDECNKNSKLILYWFSASDPINNAAFYDYEFYDNGECVVKESINNAWWSPSLRFDDSESLTPTVDLNLVTKQNDTLRLQMARKEELLSLNGQLSMDGGLVSIQREYRRLRQQI